MFKDSHASSTGYAGYEINTAFHMGYGQTKRVLSLPLGEN